jgi:hypothetical protein
MSERYGREEEALRHSEDRRATSPKSDADGQHRRDDDVREASVHTESSPKRTVGADRDTSWVSVLIGMLTALGAALLLSGLVGGIVALVIALLAAGGAQAGAGLSSLAGVLVTLFLAYLVGGYAAGRMASRKGAKHGLLAALVGVLLTILLVVIGAAVGFGISDNLSGVMLPDVPADNEQQGLGSLLALSAVSGTLVLLAPFLGGVLGGAWGARTGRRRP